MQSDLAAVMIDFEAVQMVIEWKNLFGRELNRIAREMAEGANPVGCSHYRQALPEAMDRTMRLIHSQLDQAQDEQLRAA
jgi:hypothetical protein